MRKREKLWCILLLLSTGIFLLFMWEDYKSKDSYEELQEVMDITSVLQNKTEVAENSEQEVEYNPLLEKFQELYELNPHLVGWIHIEGTAINYPVMQHKEVKDYYLHRDFEQNYSSYGVPYVDEQYENDSSNNIIIYGHAMKNGTMFADVLKYASYEYYQEHSKIIYFDGEESYEYEVFAAFPINLLEDNFAYTSYSNIAEEQFHNFLNQIESRACYSTNITPEYGDQLITLSTCESTYEDGRFIVVAVRRHNHLLQQ